MGMAQILHSAMQKSASHMADVIHTPGRSFPQSLRLKAIDQAEPVYG